MRLTVFSSILIILVFNASAQSDSTSIIENEYFSVEFPGAPEFQNDTVIDTDSIVYHYYVFEELDSTSYSLVYRERTTQDNKKETFLNEMNQLEYWTLADITNKKKGRLNGVPTLRFTATTSFDTYHYFYILSKNHFIRLAAKTESITLTPEAHSFLHSLTLK